MTIILNNEVLYSRICSISSQVYRSIINEVVKDAALSGSRHMSVVVLGSAVVAIKGVKTSSCWQVLFVAVSKVPPDWRSTKTYHHV